MKKYILRVEEGSVMNLTNTLEEKVFPVIIALVDELNLIGITGDYKQRVGEILTGDFSTITGLYKAQLEADAEKFNTASAKESILNQLEPTISGLKESVKDLLKYIKDENVDGVIVGSPEALCFFDLDETGTPLFTEESEKAIKERFTTYVNTELGAEFHKRHIALVEATNEMLEFCKTNNIRTIIPARTAFYEYKTETERLEPLKVNYDQVLADWNPAVEELEPTEVVSKRKTESTVKDIAANKERSGKRVNPDIY